MKNKLINSAFIFMAIGLACLPSFAASPGSLDPSFGVAGIVITNINGSDTFGDIAVQDDGKIVAVGNSNTGDFSVVRYRSNGTLDTTFGGTGIVSTDLNGTDLAKNVAIQADGRILVFGLTNGLIGSGLVRYNANGSLDTIFASGGKLVISGLLIDQFSKGGMAIKQDGKILIAGSSNSDLSVFQLNPNGTFDNTFDGDGVVTTNISGIDTLNDLKIQPDGKIVAVGTVDSRNQSVVLRYNANGSLDTSFSGDGMIVNDFSPSQEFLQSLEVNPIDGTIVAVGFNITPLSLQAIRLTSSGVFDTSYSGDGRFEIASAVGFDVDIQSDGKIIISGELGNRILVLRQNQNGTPDTQFGRNGIVTTPHNRISNLIEPQNLVLVGDKLLVGNSNGLVGNSNGPDFGIQRYLLSNSPTQPGDFDGDAFTDSAVYRPTTGNWFILNSSTNTVAIDQFGANGDIPIDGDFDGDGKSDVAVYRPSNGTWFFQTKF